MINFNLYTFIHFNRLLQATWSTNRYHPTITKPSVTRQQRPSVHQARRDDL